MKSLLILVAMCAAFLMTPEIVQARHPGGWRKQGGVNSQPWHGQYYYLPYGQPTALVVPPTSRMQTNYSWGVSQNTMTPITSQFGTGGVPSAGGAFYGTPIWPSHTRQFGVYPVRAPW
jgi:hypothetical protein